MRKGKILKDILKFLNIYQNSIIRSDNETANIEHYLRAKGLMDLARYYGRTGYFKEDIMKTIEGVFNDIENLTVLRIRDDLNNY
ncbi:MAG: hypothetical protein JXR86_17095 [Spirochaetales bacterium]|nr:hypothetical protein [Spirochaetales bacterium]